MRLNFEQALDWYKKDLLILGQAAHQTRLSLHPEPVVTYVVDRNINYTNVCISGCRFCAFYQGLDSPTAYVLSYEELGRKIQETMDLGGTQILLQGGMHPRLSLDYYTDLLRWIKGHFPIHIHGFSPPEILHMAHISDLSIKEVILLLKEAGLDSIPGGGAEVLSERVRKEISPKKGSAADWLKVMETAHGLGLRTTATMMFGHIETIEERLAHLFALRDLQDRTGGFTAFIPWTFQPGNTDLNVTEAKGVAYLRLLALSRLVLDNIPNIQASWVTQGPKVAQVALFFGAN
ncbi:MAG: dehypoxanthine futalosine cyclase, partial [Desulfobacca sp.]|nr:dehypoxanthine futalosine cyclase [Desulfobacca sp.]